MWSAALVAGAGLFALFRTFFRKRWWIRGRTLCPVRHRIDCVAFRHDRSIDCQFAEGIARLAATVWHRLEHRFPDQKGKRITLFVISDQKHGPGHFHPFWKDVIINLVYHTDADDIADTLAEELFHLREALAGIRAHYVVEAPKSGVTDCRVVLVRYYALNENEYRALKFAVEFVGFRVDLLKEVEQYRQEHGIGGG